MSNGKLILKSLTVGYTQNRKRLEVVRNINQQISGGDLVCLLGKNGCGKSTLLRSILGLQTALSGEIVLDGEQVEAMNPKQLARKIAPVLTDRVDIANMTVFELVAAGRIPYTGFSGMLSAQDKEVVTKALTTIDMIDFAEKNIAKLSDGERQKVMIAKALAQETPVILLDEPTAHLDLVNKLKLMKLLRQLAHEEQKLILISTHDLDLALQSADSIWLISDDHTLTAGMPEELVLNGTFEKAFADDEITFDYTRGTFDFTATKGNAFRVIGDDAQVLWTKKALVRTGFSISQNSDRLIKCSKEEGWEFDGESYQTLAELISVLKYGPA